MSSIDIKGRILFNGFSACICGLGSLNLSDLITMKINTPTFVCRSLALTLVFLAGNLLQAAELIDSFTNPTTDTNDSGTLGFRFTADSSFDVLSLGFIDVGSDGLLGSHEVGLWNASGALLDSVTVTGSSTLLNGYRYTPLTSAITLTAGSDYVIGATTSGGDAFVWQADTFITDSRITYVDSRFDPDSLIGLNFPSTIGTSRKYLFVNAEITPVPEPRLAMLACGISALLLVGLRHRRNRMG
jgi:hypothetical protein